jgi:hypothetical protein
MTAEGVGEISGLSDALRVSKTARFGFQADRSVRAADDGANDQVPALRRLLQALQNCGHFIPFSTLPAALAAFYSAPHFF